MTSLLFPDNTVLVNFALVGRMDLLGRVVRGGRGRWCGTVAKECAQSSRRPGLGDLARAHSMFGVPLYPETAAERLEVQRLRSELASPGDRSTDHLGEAETLAIMVSRRDLTAFFVTDDDGAARLAGSRKVQVITTADLFRVLHRSALLSEAEVITDMQILRAAHRRLPPPCRTDDEVRRWLRGQ